MENRYLFRGKRKDNGEWIQGYLYGIWERRYILWGMTNDIPNMVEVDPSTVCRCTGYSGIYEKDIFRYEYEDYVIKWSDDSLSWEATSLETDVSVPLGDINPDYMVVVGNEIDNPELLEE